MLISDRKERTVKQLSQQQETDAEPEVKSTKFVAQLREFTNIGGYSGVRIYCL